ncbi:MAG: tRNA (guanosine(46)-N7)-methyltransferase TrmB [Bacteroidia bacterium]|nr:tRNA (guanosine(46)-N7)-methyltransferase TrmB [Bacteroidia bacterium]
MPNKLKKFADFKSFPNCFTYVFEDLESDFKLKGKWNSDFFSNEHPIVLEIGCGYGEYTLGLGRADQSKNFIGIDRKSNRMWTGAGAALKEGLKNIAFLRTNAEFLDRCFAENEISEIWLTFPDPQPQKPRAGKRLTSPRYLEIYRKIIKTGGVIHLKTDSALLFKYTLEICHEQNINVILQTEDVYNYNPENNPQHKHWINTAVSIQTRYEKMFVEKGEKIKYMVFKF